MIKIVKYTEIHKSITNRLQTKYPDISYNSQRDITEGFDRPSFFIDLDNIKSSDFMLEARDHSNTVRIYYFSESKDNNKIELLNMQDDLNELFIENNLITVNKDIKFEVEELEFNVVDKVLHCYFDIRISENYPRDKSSIDIDDEKEMMEVLEVDNLLKE